MANGYNGKILRVNLTNGTTKAEEISESFCRKYVGGAGFGTYYLAKEVKPKIDPLGPENILTVMGGPLTGIPIAGAAKISIGCKSPLTGGYAKSETSGFFGAQMRQAGFDGIIVEGKAAKPVYLFIHNGEAELKDASKLWGKNTKETEEGIRAELGDQQVKIASIGPGGENMVRFACVMTDLKDAAGRGGTGAVMGSKNLKAIAARGTKVPEVANPDALNGYRQWLTANKKLHAGNSTFGTGVAAGMISGLAQGNLPVRNYRDGVFPKVADITATAIKETISIGMEGCYACPVRCKKVVKVDEPGMKIDPDYGGPEYEGLGALGSTCGVEDLKAICKANELCNAYSLDSISCGVAIAFAMECYERGILTNKDTGGVELKFGDTQALLKAVDLIAHREGIGDLIAEGTKRMAEKVGQGSSAYAMNAKGLEFPMHDPRAKYTLGLGYAVNPQGADHCMNMHDTGLAAPGPMLNGVHSLGFLDPVPADEFTMSKTSVFRHVQQQRMLVDCLVLCSFVPWGAERSVQILADVTGWDTGMVEMLRVAERTLTLARMFLIKEGITAADDTLPDRTFQLHIGGPAAEKKTYDKAGFEKAKQYYYSLMGWDSKGVPTPERLADLGISWAAEK
ncbi:MAG: aldehyde ferredoxin oxidoreductase family protein [Chloroflexota bacterium]